MIIIGRLLILFSEMRKIAQNHKNVERKKERRNIIDDYANFASKVLIMIIIVGEINNNNN